MRVLRTFPSLVIAALLVGCDGPPSEPVPDEALTPLFAVDRQEFSFPYIFDDEEPFIECYGELMQPHGTVLIQIREKTTPSGNTIVRGRVDYDAFGPITLEGLDSGEIWTLTHGFNPWGEVIKENGSYLVHYQWHEFYSNEAGEKLQDHLKGHVKIDPDGTVKIARESVECF